MKSRAKWYPFYGAAVGALCLGLTGGAYGAFLHLNPSYRESLIRSELSAPHPDNPRYVAAILAVRYQGFTELIIRKSVAPFVMGGLLGAAIGTGLSQCARRPQASPSDEVRSRKWSLLEFLVAIAVMALLMAILLPIGGTGLVYYDGKDQFYWLEQLAFGPESGRECAIKALCSLLERKPFPGRSTIIPALAKCGGEARLAIPILKGLTTDSEISVKTAAEDALRQLQSAPVK